MLFWHPWAKNKLQQTCSILLLRVPVVSLIKITLSFLTFTSSSLFHLPCNVAYMALE